MKEVWAVFPDWHGGMQTKIYLLQGKPSLLVLPLIICSHLYGRNHSSWITKKPLVLLVKTASSQHDVSKLYEIK
jgi:hypothetical protein